jgi:hypothetical protein
MAYEKRGHRCSFVENTKLRKTNPATEPLYTCTTPLLRERVKGVISPKAVKGEPHRLAGLAGALCVYYGGAAPQVKIRIWAPSIGVLWDCFQSLLSHFGAVVRRARNA